MSVFLRVPENLWVARNELAFAIRDQFPVSPGHTLVITRRVTPDWFQATAAEQIALLDLIENVKLQLEEEFKPDGFNVGFNVGVAAGQTVPHLHVHVIPRFRGDMDDPRGGVRHVIPSRGNYLREVDPLTTGGTEDPFARHILPLFETADDIAIVAAFVQESGLERIETAVRSALERGAHIRIVTGDYLDITQATALELLLDWEGASTIGVEPVKGFMQTRVVQVANLPPPINSFHPKSWRFESPSFGIAYVGSSNLSRSALDTGIEWNLRVDRDRDEKAYRRIRDSFERLWAFARRLDTEWISDYGRRARNSTMALSPAEVTKDSIAALPVPHEVQAKALSALRQARSVDQRRALVVLATGLGKTWLAAFDFAQSRQELGRWPRLLFIAHRSEILRQAARTYRNLLQAHGETANIGWFAGDGKDLGTELVFASVVKLARPENLVRLKSEKFDYVVVDEVHHAAAESYRKILDSVEPGFLLGLTATPDRTDSADILGLFNDYVAYTAGVPQGVELGRLVPFHYFGIKDEIDYANIPWRNRRFDPALLSSAAETESRMETLWRAMEQHQGQRSLVFCCSVRHTVFVRKWLARKGMKAAMVFAGPGSDDREGSLEQLEQGQIEAVCAVDVFNEGIDLPAIDRVIMLRPTESNIVFLQQLGRGLRTWHNKTHLTVIDFVGNHRMFLERLHSLFSLGSGGTDRDEWRRFLEVAGDVQLPSGCSVDVELEAKELLSKLFRVSAAGQVERAYRELALERGADEESTQRPTAGEMHRLGYLPSRLRPRHNSWFDFVESEGHLTVNCTAVLRQAASFLKEVEITQMTKCFKMITLEALCEHDSLISGMMVDELARHCHIILRRSPELLSDVPDDGLKQANLGDREFAQWVAYWRQNPINAWIGGDWFRLENGRFVPTLQIESQLRADLTLMTRELVDYRLCEYRQRKRSRETIEQEFDCKILWNKRDPILKLPFRSVDIPAGEVDVRLPDGKIWLFRFAKEYCNVARPVGSPRNQLPDLLRAWFGPAAGQPGTAFRVRFKNTSDGLWVEPVKASTVEISARQRIVAYPSLRAAAGHTAEAIEQPDTESILLPIEAPSPDLFAVRVSGTSMQGGRQPIQDGDFAVMRLCRGQSASVLVNRVVLVRVSESYGAAYQIKRLRRRGSGWYLTSDNPTGPTFDATEDMTVIARLEKVIQPSELAPAPGSTFLPNELATAFGLDSLQPRSGRYGGLLFIFIEGGSHMPATEQIYFVDVIANASETAFVLAPSGSDRWRYLGIGRQTDERGQWQIPPADLHT